MNVFYRSTAFTITSVCFQEEGCGETKDGGGGRPEWILYRLDKYLLPPSREPDLMMRDQKMMKRRRRRRTNDLGEGEGEDDESREAKLRHPSLGESGEGAVFNDVWQYFSILIATRDYSAACRRPIRGQRTETIARRCIMQLSAIWRCTSRNSVFARKVIEMQ
jgi:hypothetical protein